MIWCWVCGVVWVNVLVRVFDSIKLKSYLDFHTVEGLSVVYTNLAANHLGHNDHVTQVGLHNLGLVASGCVFLLCCIQTLLLYISSSVFTLS